MRRSSGLPVSFSTMEARMIASRGDLTGVVFFRAFHSSPSVDFIASCMRFSRSEEHTSELQSLMRISYAVFCLKTKKRTIHQPTTHQEPREKQKTHNHTTPHITRLHS